MRRCFRTFLVTVKPKTEDMTILHLPVYRGIQAGANRAAAASISACVHSSPQINES